MKLSQAIEILEEIRNEHGDLELVNFSKAGEEHEVEYGRTFGVLDVAMDDTPDAERMHTVCAYMQDEDEELGAGVILFQ